MIKYSRLQKVNEIKVHVYVCSRTIQLYFQYQNRRALYRHGIRNLALVVILANYHPGLDFTIIARGCQDPLLRRVPRHAVDVLRVRLLDVTHELVRVLGLHLEEPDAVVPAGRGDEAALVAPALKFVSVAALVAPVDVVGTPLVVPAQGCDAFPGGIVSARTDALLVSRPELSPDLQSEILADGRDPRSCGVKCQAPDG